VSARQNTPGGNNTTPNLPNSHYLNPTNLPWSDLRQGAWLTIVGAVIGLVSVLFVRRRMPEPVDIST
jgi:hypothetical protein